MENTIELLEQLQELAWSGKRLQDLDESELRGYFSKLSRVIQSAKTDDLLGFMLIGFQNNGICQYVSSIDPSGAPAALRELADRIQRFHTTQH